MNFSILSANYGGYDTIKVPVAQLGGLIDEWVLVTDDPNIEAPGWNVITERRPHLHPNVAAKIPKFRPDLYLPNAENSIWIDASALLKPTLARTVKSVLSTSKSSTTWTMYPHPERTKITDEVTASRGLRKYDEMDLEGQVAHYIAQGYPDGRSLWATGVMGRLNHHDRRHIDFGDDWLREVCRWSFQDQLSFPYLLWLHDFDPLPLGRDLWVAEHVWFDGHLK